MSLLHIEALTPLVRHLVFVQDGANDIGCPLHRQGLTKGRSPPLVEIGVFTGKCGQHQALTTVGCRQLRPGEPIMNSRKAEPAFGLFSSHPCRQTGILLAAGLGRPGHSRRDHVCCMRFRSEPAVIGKRNERAPLSPRGPLAGTATLTDAVKRARGGGGEAESAVG